jgi:hypothetical protein
MADELQRDTWRAWLRARFGAGLDAPTLEAAVEACEALRAVWQPVLEAAPDNGELPFPNALPGSGAGAADGESEDP